MPCHHRPAIRLRQDRHPRLRPGPARVWACKLLSTGGTAKLLLEAGLPVTEVAEHTGFPEMLDGRVKTLHPSIHGGLLARRDVPSHMAALKAAWHRHHRPAGGQPLPVRGHGGRPGCTLDDAIENIDIGGPAMVRSAAKNWWTWRC
jgi:phosphoribosylaminoimidazolecarboxamide formyltransferase/IMP cyclohydrolase